MNWCVPSQNCLELSRPIIHVISSTCAFAAQWPMNLIHTSTCSKRNMRFMPINIISVRFYLTDFISSYSPVLLLVIVYKKNIINLHIWYTYTFEMLWASRLASWTGITFLKMFMKSNLQPCLMKRRTDQIRSYVGNTGWATR